MLSEANLNRLVSKLSRMRGAALKLGQFMSIQGASNIINSGEIIPSSGFRYSRTTTGHGQDF
jgi:aarF domain-containing kinase